jgi:hypothetical protein
MTEKHITKTTAKIAKEKGFNEKHSDFYIDKKANGDFTDLPSVPQSLLQRWLREVHDIHVNPQPYHETADHTNDITGYYMGDIEHGARGKVLWVGDDNYSTYEEALEAGLLKALKEI